MLIIIQNCIIKIPTDSKIKICCINNKLGISVDNQNMIISSVADIIIKKS